MTYLFHDNISGEEREVWLLLPEPLGHNRVCHIEPRDKVPTVKSTIKGGNYIGQKPATLEYPVDGCFTQAVGSGKGRAIPMYQMYQMACLLFWLAYSFYADGVLIVLVGVFFS